MYTDCLTDGTSPLPDDLDERALPEVGHIYDYIARLPLAPCYSVFRLNTVTCECFPIAWKQRSKHLGLPLRIPQKQKMRKEL